MASLAAACRLSARLTARQLRQDAPARGFRTSAACLAAQNFTMPALSPTMTEGNIATWKLKEGDSFAAGDVLLEIETDKASMDVEAQDDGVLAKILQGDGTKGIKVGTRIGVLADEGDDLSTLEIPAEPSAAAPPKKAAKPEAKKADAVPAPKPTAAPKKSGGKAKKQKYPLLPSVENLIHSHGLDQAAIDAMTPSGPNNRLLKGDVLAYLGSITSSYPTELSTKINKLSHLDLSNIKLAAPAPKPVKAEQASKPAPAADVSVIGAVSLEAVLEVQKKIKASLGIDIPLSTFVERAVEIANDDLPRSKTQAASADELFNQVLGLDKVTQYGARGNFKPIAFIKPSVPASKKSAKPSDIYDILAGSTPARSNQKQPVQQSIAEGPHFALNVPVAEEERARVFMNRVKAALEREPGRLIL